MEFNEKIQQLRRRRGLTQEELAEKLYVSRTAVSKWESGRGYPNIESLKAIAEFFSVTVDELLSSDEVLVLAEDSANQKTSRFGDLIYGLLDLCALLLLFLPLFADRVPGAVVPSSLLMLGWDRAYLKVLYIGITAAIVLFGIAELALQNCQNEFWVKNKKIISLLLGVTATLLFTVSLQPYAAVLAFSLTAIKAYLLIKIR